MPLNARVISGGVTTVVKVIGVLKRKPGLTPVEFREHYEEVHVPLELSHFLGVKKYVRNYVIGNGDTRGAAEPDFDCITNVWFDDMEGYQAMIDALSGVPGQAIRHSSQVFLDIPGTFYIPVEEVESTIGP